MQHPGGLSSRRPLRYAALLVAALGACGVDDRDVDVVPPMVPPGSGAGQLGDGTARQPEQPRDPNLPISVTVIDAGPEIPCAPGEPAPECAAVVCPPDDLCRDFQASLPAGTCVVPGRCATAADCIAEWKPESRMGARCDCTGGTCKLAEGVTCTSTSECKAGACVPSNTVGVGICCAAACPNGCVFNGITCVDGPECEEGSYRCVTPDLELCSGGRWTVTTACGAAGCNPAGGCNAQPVTPTPATPPPSTPPPTPVGQSLCTDLCLASDLVADGICEDGTVPGVFLCDPGTDCTDCGAGANGCTDTCEIPEFNADGACDDGGPGFEFDVCDLGTDCTDCGARAP